MFQELINNQVSELFALICFFVGAGIGAAIAKDGEAIHKEHGGQNGRS